RFHPARLTHLKTTLQAAGLDPDKVMIHVIKPVSYLTKIKLTLGFSSWPEQLDAESYEHFKRASMLTSFTTSQSEQSLLLINDRFNQCSLDHTDRDHNIIACRAAGCIKPSALFTYTLLHEACHLRHYDNPSRILIWAQYRSAVLNSAWRRYQEKRADIIGVLSSSNPLGIALFELNSRITGYEHLNSLVWQELCDDLKACFSPEFLAQRLHNRKSPYIFDFEKPIEPLLVIEPKDLR
ncbi:MAG TPA: hypothetical protein VJJ83_03475, partial [Candidatus Babeliales bacterium]|nr:hypothetical protein [Candidatus Babeliales bacterium]